MTESHACPQCGEVLDVPAEMLGQPVRCGACSKVFTPKAPVLAAEFDAPTVPRRRRERAATASGGSGRRIVFIVLGVVGLLGLVCCGGFGFLIYKMMNPNWQTYESPSGDYSALFPGPVHDDSPWPTGRPGEAGTCVKAKRLMDQEEFFIATITLTPADKDKKKKPEELLEELADGLGASSFGGKEFRPRIHRTHNGNDAMDVCLKRKADHFLQARIVLANGKAYVIGVDGPGQPDGSPWVEEFLDSFQPKATGKNPFRGQ